MPIDLSIIEATTRKSSHSRQVSRLADSLSYALQIQPGSSLVPFLAPQAARNNQEAVAYWLANELATPDLEVSQQCIDVLLPRLEKRLMEIQETHP